MLEEKALPVYGNGKNIRDWLFVEDHPSTGSGKKEILLMILINKSWLIVRPKKVSIFKLSSLTIKVKL